MPSVSHLLIASTLAVVLLAQQMVDEPTADKRMRSFAFAKRSPYRTFAFAKRSAAPEEVAEEQEEAGEAEKRARFAFAKRSPYRTFAFAKRARFAFA